MEMILNLTTDIQRVTVKKPPTKWSSCHYNKISLMHREIMLKFVCVTNVWCHIQVFVYFFTQVIFIHCFNLPTFRHVQLNSSSIGRCKEILFSLFSQPNIHKVEFTNNTNVILTKCKKQLCLLSHIGFSFHTSVPVMYSSLVQSMSDWFVHI